MPDESTAQKTIVVTGATSGIGAALVDRCLADGHVVVAVGRNVAKLQSERAGFFEQLITIQADLLNEGAAGELLNMLSQRGLEVDMLVNCAGAGLLSPFEGAPIGTHCDIQRLNFEAPMRLTHALLPQLLKRRGQVVNVGSVVGYVAAPNLAALAASKAALMAWSAALRQELRGRVRVTTFCPGITRTGFLRSAKMHHLGLDRWFFASAPDAVARRILKAANADRAVAFATMLDRISAASARLTPSWLIAKLAGLVLVPAQAGAELE